MNADFKYTLEFYELLKKNSKIEEIDGIEISVWRGALTKEFRKLGASQTYYSKVTNSLKDLGCINVLKRGARGVESVVACLHPPDEMEFLIRQSVTPGDLTRSPEGARLAQRLENIEAGKMGGMNIVDALENLDKRLKGLDRRVKALEQKSGG